MSALFNALVSDSVVLFVVTFILSVSSAYAGKYLFKKRHGKTELADDETKIVLGAVLSLLGLLIGFLLTISIGGYNNREQMEENEPAGVPDPHHYRRPAVGHRRRRDEPHARRERDRHQRPRG